MKVRAYINDLYFEQLDVARIQVFKSIIGLVNLNIESQMTQFEYRIKNEPFGFSYKRLTYQHGDKI